ncbi:MAG: PLP-dependent aspartate aminotransferase family protein [Paludibacteraceae bacterium]
MDINIETLLANLSLYTDTKNFHGATHIPIFNTATFDLKKQENDDFMYDYSRTDNPTRNAIETIFAKAENGYGCVCTNTGIASVSLLFDTVLKTGDTVLVETDCYGGTNRLLNILSEKNNITTIFADFTCKKEVEESLQNNNVKLVLCESPTNPGLKIIDLESVGNLCKKHNALFAVDNSMATFASQKPIDLGADFSVFSTTKFISGHGSVTAGAIVSKTEIWHKKVHYLANALGLAQSPMDVFLTSLGITTLVVRMKAQEVSALKIANRLASHKNVVQVNYPAMREFPQYELAKRQMKIIPSVLTIRLDTPENAEKILKNTRLFGKKVSFGTVDSRMEIPAKMSHATNSETQLAEKGITLSTVRISVGLENTDDLIADIQNALM